MHALTHRGGAFLLFAVLCTVCLAAVLRADSGRCQKTPSAIEEKIQRHRQRIEEGKESLSELSRRERELYTELVGLRDRIKDLTSRMRNKEDRLLEKQQERKELQRKNKELVRRISDKKGALRQMLTRMWPLYIKNREAGPGWVVDPGRIRRNYAWLRSVYSMVRDRLASLRAEQEELSANLKRLRRVKRSVSKQLREIEETKDRLLKQKLAFLDKIQEVRAERLAKREQLERVRESVEELRYRLKHTRKQDIARLKGGLPWPAEGEVVDPDDGEARKGLTLSLDKGEKVQAVAWGKVVYNDKLRGFGRVVIILHSQEYYSLYAYLLSSRVEMGERIEQGEVLGRAGFHPRLSGPGLYFELRQGQRPVDPMPWLADRTGRG